MACPKLHIKLMLGKSVLPPSSFPFKIHVRESVLCIRNSHSFSFIYIADSLPGLSLLRHYHKTNHLELCNLKKNK